MDLKTEPRSAAELRARRQFVTSSLFRKPPPPPAAVLRPLLIAPISFKHSGAIQPRRGYVMSVIPMRRSSHAIARGHVEDVCRRHLIGEKDLLGNSRAQRFSEARHELYYLIARDTTWSMRRIGEFCGGRDHSTIRHGMAAFIIPNGVTPYTRSAKGPVAIPIGGPTSAFADIHMRDVCERHAVRPHEIRGRSRLPHIAAARHEFYYLMVRETNWSLRRIGEFCGGRSHASVSEGITSHRKRSGAPSFERKGGARV